MWLQRTTVQDQEKCLSTEHKYVTINPGVYRDVLDIKHLYEGEMTSVKALNVRQKLQATLASQMSYTRLWMILDATVPVL